eukprot:750375-Rhodomonas_salina.1
MASTRRMTMTRRRRAGGLACEREADAAGGCGAAGRRGGVCAASGAGAVRARTGRGGAGWRGSHAAALSLGLEGTSFLVSGSVLSCVAGLWHERCVHATSVPQHITPHVSSDAPDAACNNSALARV